MLNGGIQIRIGDLIYAVKKRWKLIATLTFIGLIFGIMLSGVSYLQGTMSRNYSIRGSFLILDQSSAGNFSVTDRKSPAMDDMRLSQEMIKTCIYVIRSDRTLKTAIDHLELVGITTRDISSNLSMGQYNDTLAVEFNLTWRSADEGIAIMNAILEVARGVLLDTLGFGNVVMIDSPTSRYLMGGSLNASVWVYMVALGFIAGVGIAVLELIMRPTLLDLKDVESSLGLETLGVIPRDDIYFRKKTNLLVKSDDTSESQVEDNYSSAAYILRNRLGIKEKNHCFYVTSAQAGEGKSTAAANLAIQLSDMEHKVLLVDFHTRNPSLGGLFLEKVDYSRSLNALYRGDATVVDAITTLTGYLDFLPVVLEHHTIPLDGTVVDLIENLKEKYEYVIMDAAPVGQVADTMSLNQIASDVVFVVRYDYASMQEIREAIEKLDKSGIRIVGAIVNEEQAIGQFGQNAATAENQSSRKAKGRRAKVSTAFDERSEKGQGKDDLMESLLVKPDAEQDKDKDASQEKTRKKSGRPGRDSSRSQRRKERSSRQDRAQKPKKSLGLFGRKSRKQASADDGQESAAAQLAGTEQPEVTAAPENPPAELNAAQASDPAPISDTASTGEAFIPAGETSVTVLPKEEPLIDHDAAVQDEDPRSDNDKAADETRRDVSGPETIIQTDTKDYTRQEPGVPQAEPDQADAALSEEDKAALDREVENVLGPDKYNRRFFRRRNREQEPLLTAETAPGIRPKLGDLLDEMSSFETEEEKPPTDEDMFNALLQYGIQNRKDKEDQ
ncbi:MAG: AAA family ATPase [Blautia sp.]|nr:AAA family ATPase [Blautia sp.]